VYDITVIRWTNILYLLLMVTPLVGCGLVDSQEARQTALKAGLEAAEARGKSPSLSALDLNQSTVVVDLMNRSIGPQLTGLGPLNFKLDARFELTADGATQVKIEDTIRLEVDAEGRFSLDHGTTSSALGERERKDGRRCWWVDGQYFIGRLHGPATQVPTNGDEQNVCLQSSLDPLRGFLAIVGDRLESKATGSDRLVDRVVERLELTQDSAAEEVDAGMEFSVPVPETYPKDPEKDRSKAIWGPRTLLVNTHLEVDGFEGKIALDEVTGIPLSADIKGRFRLEKGEKRVVMTVAMVLAVEKNDDEITPPQTDRRFVPRQRIFADRALLLGQKTVPGKGKKRAVLPTPGDSPKLSVGPDGRLIAAPKGQRVPPTDTQSPLPRPGDAPKLVLGPNGLVQAGPQSKDGGVAPETTISDEDAPEPRVEPIPPTPPSKPDAFLPVAKPPMGPPIPPKKPPMGPPTPAPKNPSEDEDLPL